MVPRAICTPTGNELKSTFLKTQIKEISSYISSSSTATIKKIKSLLKFALHKLTLGGSEPCTFESVQYSTMLSHLSKPKGL